MERENLLEKSGEMYAYIQEYVRLQLEYFRLEAAEKTGKIISSLVVISIFMLIGAFILMMFSLAAGMYLGKLFQSYPLAFLVLMGFYMVLGFALFLARDRWITTPIIRSIINDFFD
jgi:membrane-bound ClpP family serine protease